MKQGREISRIQGMHTPACDGVNLYGMQQEILPFPSFIFSQDPDGRRAVTG
jgi:hypothetical protein